ncbi:hypothetical protein BDV34DRAFT_188555 [Aspergillus parasiticus]|uniref:Uncharacterized protein n=1 Tax=Aspergillus parasiticus TaxID=5067 RepID=A0A5N6DWE5_ASPPA|nr:hypothetical protein BDV34DRAFT_188555 [Aspergillus parasiticus]
MQRRRLPDRPQLNSSWLCTCNTYMMHAYVHGVYRTPYTRPVLCRNYFRSLYSISIPLTVLRFRDLWRLIAWIYVPAVPCLTKWLQLAGPTVEATGTSRSRFLVRVFSTGSQIRGYGC